jgi:hypothetical protein
MICVMAKIDFHIHERNPINQIQEQFFIACEEAAWLIDVLNALSLSPQNVNHKTAAAAHV